MQGPRCHRGLTIIEMMVAVAVLAVLAALAAPSLREFMARQRVAAINAELVTDLQFARSEAITRGRQVRVYFREDDTMTCYTLHTFGLALGNCNCLKPLGTACDEVPNLIEIKTTQVLKSTSVTVRPPGAFPYNYMIFTDPKGLASWRGHAGDSADYVTNWQDFKVTVESSISGKLRTATNLVGRPQVCSPNGSISGVLRCVE
jgi:type IV fimbrial biogenesis protein FimT